MKTFKELLIELEACGPAIEWANDKTIKEVVEECHRGDWLLWLAHKVDIGLHPLTLAKGHCANTVRHFMEDERSVKSVDVAIAFGEGKATLKELKDAADFAYAPTYADDAAYAAADAAYADYVATYAAYVAVAEKEKNQMQTADICRKYIGELIIEKVNLKLNDK